MAEPIKTPHTGITATYNGPAGANGVEHSYRLKNAQSGAEEDVVVSYGPEDDQDQQGKRRPGFKSLLGVDFNSEEGQELASTLAPSFAKLQYKDQRGYLDRGVKPVIRSIPAFFVGGPWDVMGLLSYVPGLPDLVAMGYEAVTGDDPLGMNERRRERGKAFRKDVEEFYGTEATRRRYQQNLRAFDNYAEDNWNFRPFEATVGTDMTPEARGVWEKMTTTGLEMAVSGPVMISGVTVPAKVLQETAKFTFARLAKESAKELGEDALDPKNILSLIDKANGYVNPLTKTGRRNIRSEAAYGFAGGVSTEAALSALNEVDPDAAGWVKMSVAIGSGLVAPLAARSIYTGFLQGPVISLATKITDPLFRPGKTAARYTQNEGMGKSSEDRAGIASVARLFEEAVKDGRHVDQASGLAFTTPELARSESNILRSELQLKRERLGQETDPDVRARLEKEIQTGEADVGYLNTYANFQESVLISAGKDKSPGIVAKFFKNEANRLVQRREQFFNYIENNFKKSMDDLDFGGKEGGTPQEIRLDYASAKNGEVPVFEDTRRKLVMEGDPKGVEASELAWLDPQLRDKVGSRREDLTRNMDEAFAKSQRAAEDRVKFWEESVQSYLADRGLSTLPDAEKALVGDIIRGTYDDAYREFRAFEKAAYGRIKGLDDKVTENIVFPERSVDPVDNSNISGMTVDEWAAGRLDNLSRSERFNIKEVPVELAQLAGSRSVIAQLNRRRAAAVAEGRADAAQSRIPDLERQRDEVVAQKTKAEAELDTQVETERLDSERLARSFEEYVQSRMANLDDSQKAAVLEFASSPTVGGGDWSNITIQEARARAPVGLEDVFAQVAKQKKAMATLGEGVASSKAVQMKRKEVLALGKEAQGFQSDIDKITRDFLGAGDDVVIEPTGRLTSRDADGGLIAGGTSADDVQKTISDVAEAARREVATNGKTPRYRSLLQVRQTLEQLLSPETFPTLDPASLAFGREASRLKHRVDDAQGDILGKDKGAAVKVPVEEVATKVLPEASSPLTRAYNLRVLNEAVAELPDFVTIKRGDDGKIVTDAEGIPVAAIDEDALKGGQSLFDHPDSPFELVRVGEAGTPFEIRLKPDAPVSPRSLQVAESILLERMALRFPDGVDSKSLESFRNKNRETLQFLEVNGRGDVPKMLNDADGLAAQLDALNTLRKDKTRRQLTELVNSGTLDLQGLKIDDYLDYIGQRRRRFSEEIALSEVLKADAGYATAGLFDRILDPNNTKPTTSFNEFMSVVRGSRPAEKGLQASIIGELFRRSTTRDNAVARDALIRQTGDVYASAFDPAKFRELMSNSRVRSLLQEAFPDNPQLLDGLDDIARVAFETSTFTRGSARMAAAVDPQAAVSTEAWSNLGRILGLQVADRIGFINSLVAAGAGGRAFRNVGKNITGNKIKDILIEAAIDPKRAIELARKTSELGDGLAITLAKGVINIVNVPGAVIRRPGAGLSIIERGTEELDEPGGMGDRSSVQPAGPPPRRMAADMQLRPPVRSSLLSQASGTGQAPAPTGQQPAAPPVPNAATTPQRMEEIGLPLFGPGFRHGGYVTGGAGSGVGRMEESGIMSVPRKPRQLVG
jgi:hypothetical protein